MRPRRLFAKIFFISAAALAIFSIAAYFYAKPFFLSLVNKELQKIIKESHVSDMRFTRDFIGFQDIEMRDGALYHLKIKEARVYYNLDSILDGKIEKVFLDGVYSKVNITRDGLPGLYPFPAGPAEGQGRVSIAKFEAVNISLDLTIDDMKMKGNASLQIDLSKKAIDYLKLNISSLSTSLFQAEGAALSVVQNQDDGEFYIKAVNYNKLKIGDVTGKAGLKGDVLSISPVLVSFLGGNVKGEFSISLDKGMDYSLRLDSQGLEIKKFVDDMKFDEKFNMTGIMEGGFFMSGRGQEIMEIKGNFHSRLGGGILIIKDKAFLENVAKQANQPLDIIVESFRNYAYNNGIVGLDLEAGNLVMNLRLMGKTGKRDLTVVLHDFKKSPSSRAVSKEK